MFKDYKQYGYFDELRKDVLDGWMKSDQGKELEKQIHQIIVASMQGVSGYQYSMTLAEAEEERARLTALIRENINESGVLKKLPDNLWAFVKLKDWADRISSDLDKMKSIMDNKQ